MSRGKHTEAQMISALKQVEAGRMAEDVAGEIGVSKHRLYEWNAKYGGLNVNEARRLREFIMDRWLLHGGPFSSSKNRR